MATCTRCETEAAIESECLCSRCQVLLSKKIRSFNNSSAIRIKLREPVRNAVAELAGCSYTDPLNYINEIIEAWIINNRPDIWKKHKTKTEESKNEQ